MHRPSVTGYNGRTTFGERCGTNMAVGVARLDTPAM